jgi:hypothetical protein
MHLPIPEANSLIVTTSYNAVVRSGPGTKIWYGAFFGRKTVQGVGANQEKNWWVVNIPSAASGVSLVPANFTSVTGGSNLPCQPTPPVPAIVNSTLPATDNPQATTLAEVFVRTCLGKHHDS